MERGPKGKCRRKYKLLLVLKEEKRTNDQIGIRIKVEKTLFCSCLHFPSQLYFLVLSIKKKKCRLEKCNRPIRD